MNGSLCCALAFGKREVNTTNANYNSIEVNQVETVHKPCLGSEVRVSHLKIRLQMKILGRPAAGGGSGKSLSGYPNKKLS